MSQFSVIPSLVLCKWPSSTNRRVICAEACIDNQSTIIDKARVIYCYNAKYNLLCQLQWRCHSFIFFSGIFYCKIYCKNINSVTCYKFLRNKLKITSNASQQECKLGGEMSGKQSGESLGANCPGERQRWTCLWRTVWDWHISLPNVCGNCLRVRWVGNIQRQTVWQGNLWEGNWPGWTLRGNCLAKMSRECSETACRITSLYMLCVLWFVPPWFTHKHTHRVTDKQTAFDWLYY